MVNNLKEEKQSIGVRESNGQFMFLKELFNQIHCYLYHLFDLKLRSTEDGIRENDSIDMQSDDFNGKFSIDATCTDMTDETFMDGLNEHLSSINQKEVITTLQY